MTDGRQTDEIAMSNGRTLRSLILG